jgi:uncharacterized oxidoreductase
VLGFVPLAFAAVHSSTKATLHSYSQSLRYKLAGSSGKGSRAGNAMGAD